MNNTSHKSLIWDGPDSIPSGGCDACGSTKWATLTSCYDCGAPVCDLCTPGPLGEELQCAVCYRKHIEELLEEIKIEMQDDCSCYCVGDQADASDCPRHGRAA